MSNSKMTRRALLTSVMALVLCFAMLTGTTFAWFTDQETSGNNKIIAGNLDIEMYNALTADDAAIIEEGTLLFDGVKFWEPGVVSYENITVANKGNLALKYQLSMNFEDKGLADALKVGVIKGGVADGTSRDAVKAAVATWMPIASFVEVGELVADDNDAATTEKTTETYGIVIYWEPSDNDNAYNGNDKNTTKEFFVNFGVKLVATQLMAEEDAFGKDYDEDASWGDPWDGTIPSDEPNSLVVDTNAKLISINDADAFVYLDTLLNDGNFVSNYGAKWQYSIELNCDVDLLGKEWTPIYLSNVVCFDGKGHKISNLKITSGNDSVGLFSTLDTNDLGYGTIKNLTIDGAYVKGGDNSGVLVGSSAGTIENVTVLNATIEAKKYVGGLAGRTCYVENCAIKNSTVVASDKTVGGLVGYSIGDPNPVTATGNTVENVTVTGTYNVGGMLGQAQNVTVDGNIVKNVTVASTTALPADASSNEVRTAEVAARSAFDGTTIGTNTVENVRCGIEVYGLTLVPNGENSQIIVNDKEGFLNLSKLFNDWTALFTDGNGSAYSNYANGAGVDYYYAGRWTVSLEADIDLNNATIAPVIIKHPVSAGAPAFDGNDHTISNAKIVTDANTENEAGLFNANYTAFKNLKLDNIHVTGSNVGNSTAGVLSGSVNADQGVQNITITHSSVTGGKYTGGVVGYGYTDITNCTLTNVIVKGGYKLGGVIGYICASGTNTGDVTGNTLTDCTVDGIGGGVFAGGKDKYVIGQVVGNYNCNGTCNDNTITNMTTSATTAIGEIEAGLTVTQ